MTDLERLIMNILAVLSAYIIICTGHDICRHENTRGDDISARRVGTTIMGIGVISGLWAVLTLIENAVNYYQTIHIIP